MPESTAPAIERIRLLVRGVVQGVGFRPFVYNLALRLDLSGIVLNSASGAVIEVEGPIAAIEGFVFALRAQAPPLARIVSIERERMEPAESNGFAIGTSLPDPHAFTPLPPDLAPCAECSSEVRDPGNRRFAYPFTNCTSCGPRYSIILDIPYDRPATTMAGFEMCAQCRAEYEDPANRRFHAQPNACAVCGPRLHLREADGAELAGGDPERTLTLLGRVAQLLQDGRIVAWKGAGGYQLACDARQPAVVAALRQRKHRSEKAFAVMMESAQAAAAVCRMDAAEQAALEAPSRPIVLLERRIDSGLAEEVAPGNGWCGLMLPSTPMHELLFRALRERADSGAPVALVMTSGNLSEEPIMMDSAAAAERLAGIADAFVHHDRPIHNRVDDSLVHVFDGAPMLLRRARGYAPSPIALDCGDLQVLACGAQQKSTFCLTRTGSALLSQHLGDLENYETLEFYQQILERMTRLFHVTPAVVAHDLHPDYLSTRLALARPEAAKMGIQHHHAHVASCMAEHGLAGSVIGVAWDGTGFGTDGSIWGGEFLLADRGGFRRFASLRPVLLAGGDRAVREPWRVARGYLRDAFASEIPKGATAGELDPAKVALLDTLLERKVATVPTSSCGRLFDAVAALAGLRQMVSFEGQAAMLLEAVAAAGEGSCYPFELVGSGPVEIDARAMIRAIVEQVRQGVAVETIAARFHNTLVEVVVEVCGRMREQYGLARVCLSGGCFQNLRLLRGSVDGLHEVGFEVYFHRQVPANDGGISLGQAAIACERMRRGDQGDVSGDSWQGS